SDRAARRSYPGTHRRERTCNVRKLARALPAVRATARLAVADHQSRELPTAVFLNPAAVRFHAAASALPESIPSPTDRIRWPARCRANSHCLQDFRQTATGRLVRLSDVHSSPVAMTGGLQCTAC